VKKNTRLSLIFVILASILIPISSFVWWIRMDILNTDRYVQLITPVISNPAVQTSISNYLTDTIFQRVDTTQIIKNALPQQSSSLVQVINQALMNFTYNQVLRLVQSDQFSNLWSSANRIAQQKISQLLLGQGKVLALENGNVVIDFNQVVGQIKTRLSDNGLTAVANAIPQQNYNYVLFSAPVLTKLQNYISILNSLYPWIQLLIILLFGLAIWFSSNRLNTVKHSGIGILISAGVMALVLAITRGEYIKQATGPYYTSEVASVFFDALTKPFWIHVLIYIIVGVTAIVASLYLVKRPKTK
jgi:hypothetical protein